MGISIVFWICINWLIGFLIGQKKNAVDRCVALSIFLGPLGWLIAALLEGDCRKCSFCAEHVKPEAIVCPHCQRDLPKIEASPPPVVPVLPAVNSPSAFDQDARRAIIIIGGALLLIIGFVVIKSSIERSDQRAVENHNTAALQRRMMIAETPEAAATPTPPEFVRLTMDYPLLDPKGRDVKTLDPGKRLRVIARFEHDITVDYLGQQFSIPAGITEPSK